MFQLWALCLHLRKVFYILSFMQQQKAYRGRRNWAISIPQVRQEALFKTRKERRIAGCLGVLGGARPLYRDKQLNSQLVIQRCHQLDPQFLFLVLLSVEVNCSYKVTDRGQGHHVLHPRKDSLNFKTTFKGLLFSRIFRFSELAINLPSSDICWMQLKCSFQQTQLLLEYMHRCLMNTSVKKCPWS